MRLSIIVPMLNEAEHMFGLCQHLLKWQAVGCEVIIVDGGSDDGSACLARDKGLTVLTTDRGRAHQMNTGAHQATGDILLFLHADTRLPDNADQSIKAALKQPDLAWGRFDIEIDGMAKMFKIIAPLINLRSRLSGIATGDQAIFVRRSTFEVLGGFADIALMEDIEISTRLRKISRPVCLRAKAKTSGRRWDDRGVWRTIFLMWRLRSAYFRGASPHSLARLYR